MQALAFWKAVAMDKSDFLEGLIGLLADHKINYCVIGVSTWSSRSIKWKKLSNC